MKRITLSNLLKHTDNCIVEEVVNLYQELEEALDKIDKLNEKIMSLHETNNMLINVCNTDKDE